MESKQRHSEVSKFIPVVPRGIAASTAACARCGAPLRSFGMVAGLDSCASVATSARR
jgi:precorrin-3B methylase